MEIRVFDWINILVVQQLHFGKCDRKFEEKMKTFWLIGNCTDVQPVPLNLAPMVAFENS